MGDQAEMLRNKINMKSSDKTSTLPSSGDKQSRVIAVTSGKGGVGKTNIAVNLAIALSKKGLKVVILDADFGLANIDLLLGMIPKYSLLDLIRDNKNIFEVLTDGPDNIKFLSGGSGAEELIRLDRNQLRKFVSNISVLDRIFDVIIIDTGAGLSRNVRSLLFAADEVILVLTPEPTSITDAYALVKIVSRRDPRKPIQVLVNKAVNAREGEEIADKLIAVSERFLSLKLTKLGYILYDDTVVESVKMQKPFSIYNSRCAAARNISDVADKLTENYVSGESSGAKAFISKLLSFFGV